MELEVSSILCFEVYCEEHGLYFREFVSFAEKRDLISQNQRLKIVVNLIKVHKPILHYWRGLKGFFHIFLSLFD